MPIRIHAAVAALGLPVRLIPTTEQRGNCSQATALIDGFEGVCHIIADAAHDSAALRKKIKGGRGAQAHIQASHPARSSHSSISTFMSSVTRSKTASKGSNLRRIVLRCEKTLFSVMGFNLPRGMSRPMLNFVG
ncbi:transposase [Paracoccus bogoriensis]|nr:transposase [Paracoccus bogoriensis]